MSILHENCTECGKATPIKELMLFGGICEKCDLYSITDEDEFECCGDCDMPDACADFGCAIKQGLKEPDLP